jgi:hypothetical protein
MVVIDQTNIILWFTVIISIFIGLLIAYSVMFILGISEAFTKLATYHTPKSKTCLNGEPFRTKLWKVFWVYIFLSIFFFFAIVVTMKFSGATNLNSNYITAEIGTLFLLILVRLSLNPVSDYTLKRIFPKESPENALRIFKERISSLFFSYITITWMVLFFYLLSHISGTVSSQSETNFIPSDLQPGDIYFLLITYIISLLILTVVSEFYLRWRLPIDQTPWNNTKQKKIF